MTAGSEMEMVCRPPSDLAGDVELAVCDLQFRGERGLGHAGQRRKHRAGLAVVAIDALLAEQHDVGLFLVLQRL